VIGAPPGATVADIVHATFPYGAADAEYRPETLRAGDFIRWMRRLHAIEKTQPRPLGGVFLWLVDIDPDSPTYRQQRVVMFKAGCWVFAIPLPRSESA
jgi:hypothetical protein